MLPLVDRAADAPPCCTPLAQAPLSAEQAQQLSSRLKAVADPARLRLLSLLLASPEMEACTCELTGPLGLSQPTVSHHLRKLLEAGLVTAEARGVWTYYRADPDTLSAVADALNPSIRA
jgi:ArsR family transcriptional regulator, arsenate/arsenite/antimonite-responsive transcriptional repressor